MSREIMIIAKDKNGVISNNIVKIGENGEHIVIKGTKDTFYEIKDMATNRAPDQIYTKRFKNDLKLKINPKGGALDGVGEADVTIENYCANGNCEIVGVHESGEYYQYVPQSGDADLGTTKMADGEFAYQSLGTVEAGGFGPLSLLPLAGLGGLGGGGGGTKPDTTAPDAPNLTMVTDDFDAQAALSNGDNNDGTVDVWGADNDTGSWRFDSTTGEWSVYNGNVNVTSDGKIITNDGTPTLSGTGGEAGATVAVYNGTTLLGSVIVGSNGDWSVTIEESNKLADGDYSLFLTQTDTAGNVNGGTTIDVIVDTKFPLYNYEINIADTGIDARNEGRSSHLADNTNARLGENYYFTNKITLSDDYVKTTGPGTVDNVSYTEGDSIYITLHNKTTGETYLIGGPDGPSVVVDSSGKWSIDISSANAWNATYGYTTLADGEYSADIMIYELSGNTRTYTASDFAIDMTAPITNNVEYVGTVNNNSSVIASDSVAIGGIINGYNKLQNLPYGEDGDGVMERDQDYLVGTGPAEIFIYRDGEEVGNKYVGTSTENTWGFTETLSEGVYRYQVDTMDVAGNTSGLGDSFWVYVDADTDKSYNLTTADDIVSKDFSNMVLVGNTNSETFTLDNVGFKSIDGGAGTDTFTLLNDSGILNITQTANFEVYNINNNTLTINGDVNVEVVDHIVINGTSSAKVDLSTDWSVSSSQTQTGYTIYSNNDSDNLWIQTGVSVI